MSQKSLILFISRNKGVIDRWNDIISIFMTLSPTYSQSKWLTEKKNIKEMICDISTTDEGNWSQKSVLLSAGFTSDSP